MNSIALLTSIIGQKTTYSNLLGLLRHVGHDEFKQDPMRNNALLWPDHAVVVIDKPLNTLTPDDKIVVNEVVNVSDEETPPPEPEKKAVDEQINEKPRLSKSTTVTVEPLPMLARALATNKKAMRDIRKRLQKLPSETKPVKMSKPCEQYLNACDAQRSVDAIAAYTLLESIPEDDLPALISKWFPRESKLANEHKHNVDKYMDAVDAKTEEDLRIALILWAMFTDTETMRFDEASENVRNVASNITRMIRSPFERIAPLDGSNAECKKAIKAVQSSTLFETGPISMGLYMAVRDVLASEKLSIDMLERKLTKADCKDIVCASSNMAELIDDDDDVNRAAMNVTCFALTVVKRMAMAFSEERALALDLINKQAQREKQAKVDEQDDVEEETVQPVNNDEILKLTAEVERLKGMVDEKQSKLNSMQLAVDKLVIQNDQLEHENDELREFMNAVERGGDDEELDDNCPPTSEQTLPTGTVLIGGHPRWQKFFKQAYPDTVIVDGVNPNFNAGLFNKKTPLVLINPLHMKHSVFHKLMPLLRRFNIKHEYRTRIVEVV